MNKIRGSKINVEKKKKWLKAIKNGPFGKTRFLLHQLQLRIKHGQEKQPQVQLHNNNQRQNNRKNQRRVGLKNQTKRRMHSKIYKSNKILKIKKSGLEKKLKKRKKSQANKANLSHHLWLKAKEHGGKVLLKKATKKSNLKEARKKENGLDIEHLLKSIVEY